MEPHELLENKIPQLKQTGLFASKMIDEYGFDSSEGISATEMYEQTITTFNALHQIDSIINFRQ